MFTDFLLFIQTAFTALILSVKTLLWVIFTTSFLYIRVFDVILLFTFVSLIVGLMTTTLFRVRFGYFLLLVFFIAIGGFKFGFDGLIFFFLLTEYLILLLFLIIALNNYSPLVKEYVLVVSFGIFVLLGFVVYLWGVSFNVTKPFILTPWFYTLAREIISNDLFVFFFFFFLEYLSFVWYITLILSFFSIIFIAFYFQYKLMQQSTKNAPKKIELLRKQEALKQSKQKVQTRMFSN